MNLQEFWLQDRLIRTRDHTISRHGEVLKVEPKVMAVLLELAQRPGEVLLRDELLASLWTEGAASDEALSRCIYLLRKALGDGKDGAAFIETVPKSGYRLLVTPAAAAPAIPAASGIPTTPATHLETVSPTRPATDFTGNSWRTVVAMVLVTAVVGVFVVLPGDGQPDAMVRPQVFVLPIQAQPPDTRLGMLALGLTDSIRIAALTHSGPNVTFVAHDQATVQLASSDHYAVRGVLQPNPGERTALLVLYIDSLSPSGQVTAPLNLFEIPLVASLEELETFKLRRDAVVARLMTYLVEDLPGVHNLTPLQIEAFRLLMYADWEIYTGNDCGLGALPLLQRSIDLWPDFSRTWGQLAEAHWQQVWECGKSSEHIQQALDALQHARSIDPDDFYGVYLHAMILTYQGELEAADDFLAPYLEASPDEPYYLQAQYQLLVSAGMLSAADQTFEQMLAAEPLALSSDLLDLPMSYFYQQDYAAFLHHAPTRPTAQTLFFRALANIYNNNTERARDLLARQRVLGSPGLFAQYGQVLLDYLDGDTASARAGLRAVIRARTDDSMTSGQAHFTLAQLSALLGEHTLAQDEALAAFHGGFICLQCFEHPVFAGIVEMPE